MIKCYICKFPYDEFYKCKLENNDNIYDICFKCGKYEALNNKNFKWLDESNNTNHF